MNFPFRGHAQDWLQACSSYLNIQSCLNVAPLLTLLDSVNLCFQELTVSAQCGLLWFCGT